MKVSILCFLLISHMLFADQFFVDKQGDTVRLAVAETAEEVAVEAGKQILVASFMEVYEDVPLVDLNPNFKSTGDVRRFYEDYFESEFKQFQKGHLTWIQAFIGEKLVGWATFELEENNHAYMNLLAVDPSYQKERDWKAACFFYSF